MLDCWPSKVNVNPPEVKKQKPYTPIHCHTSYSTYDACVMPAELVKVAARMGLKAISISDHGSLSGVFQFIAACEEHGLKPIVGYEAYLNAERKEEKKNRNNQHLCLFAMNQEGWKNLLMIHYDAVKNGFYYKPRTDLDFIAEHSAGLIATTACLGSPLLKTETPEEAEANLQKLKDAFGERLFVELQFSEQEVQKEATARLIQLAQNFEVEMCYGLDSHYAYPFDVFVQDVLMLANRKKTINDEEAEKFLYPARKLWLKSYGECLMEAEMNGFDVPRELVKQALANNDKIADMVNFKLEKGVHFPKFKMKGKSVDSDKFLGILLNRNFMKAMKSGKIPEGKESEYRARMQHEYKIICQCGYSDYFLLIWDMCRASKERGIFLAGGRGSAAGCLVSYVLEISNIDSIKHGLLFERFIDVNRKDFPDIDLDFESVRGNEVEKYLKEKYGTEQVTHVGTFSYFKTKSAILEILKVLGEKANDVFRLTKLMEADHREGIIPADELDEKIDELITSSNKKVSDILQKHRSFGFQLAKRLAGNVRHTSLHAGGTIVSPEPIYNYIPVMKTKQDIATGWAQGGDGRTELEKIGLVKIDILKVSAASIIKEAIELVKERNDVDLAESIWQIDLNDKKVLKYYSEGFTEGVFQVETDLVTGYLKRLKPERFSDVVACLGLVRPGTLSSGEADKFIKMKNGTIQPNFIHPSLKEITKETRGTFVFQEQLMNLMHKVAGFPISETLSALKLLKQLYKSEGDERLDEIVGKFKKGLIEHGDYTEEQAEELVDMLKEFWLYVFNKSHATAYAVTGFQMMWLKVYYPTEFYCALLRHTENKKEDKSDEVKTKKYIDEARKLGIKVFPPRFKRSKHLYTIEADKIIRCGTQMIVGIGAAGKQLEMIEGETFHSMLAEPKLDARKLNKTKITRLIRIGFFDGRTEEKMSRKQFETAYGYFVSDKKKYSDIHSRWQLKVERALQEVDDEYEESELLKFEKEAYRFYFSNHPISKYKSSVEAYNRKMKEEGKSESSMIRFPSELAGRRKKARIIGYISKARITTVKHGASKGRKMAIVSLGDGHTFINLLIWPKYYPSYEKIIREGSIILCLAKAKKSDEGLSFELNDSAKMGRQIVEPEKIFEKVLQTSGKEPITRIVRKVKHARN